MTGERPRDGLINHVRRSIGDIMEKPQDVAVIGIFIKAAHVQTVVSLRGSY